MAVYCLALLFIVFAHQRLRPVYRYMILSLAIMAMLIRGPAGLTVTFLDVGQGEAIFIATPDRRYYLVDGGSSTVSGLGEYRILPFLKSQGVSRLDGWIITHPHADHYSAFPELAAKMKQGGVEISRLVLPDIGSEYKDEEYLALENIAVAAGIDTIYISRGQSFAAGKNEEIYFHCLNPLAGRAWITAEANAYSTVLLLTYGAFSLLLTGDAEGAGEADMKQYLADQKLADGLTVLSVAHHGSRNATDEEFLGLTMPGYAVISAGRGNSYGHPHRELLGRLAGSGAEVYITYESGAVTIKTDGARMQLKPFLK
jgi:competence protein ComEC